MERHVAHIWVPAFPIQMEVLRFPRLKQRPFAVVSTAGERGIVRATSPAAEHAGVRKGMLLSAAKNLCRDLEAVGFDQHYYLAGSEAVFHTVSRMSPVVEPVHFGRAYADLSLVVRQPHHLVDAGWKTIKEIHREIGVIPTVGLASNKLVSAIASQASEQNNLCRVELGNEKNFLRPFPADRLPVVDESMWTRLCLVGLRHIGRIADFAAPDLGVVFGRRGLRLHEEACGIDLTPVMPPRPDHHKVFGAVMTPDTNDVEVLRDRLFRLVESAGMELRADRVRALRLILQIEYSDQKRDERATRLAPPTAHDHEMKEAAARLLEKAVTRRVSIRLLTLRISEMVPAAEQLSLFAPPIDEKRRRINRALDEIRGRFGEGAIGYARVA